MKTIYGIDIGGTQVKACAFDVSGKLLAQQSLVLGEGTLGPERVREAMEVLEEMTGRVPDGLGLAAPGLAAEDETHIACLPGNKVAIEGLIWREYLPFEKPLRILNDAHAALYGELWQGAARGRNNVVLVTLGTGVGGAVLSEGQLVRGNTGKAGHLGHICMDPDGEPGICGMPGSFEDYLGNQSIEKRSNGRFASTSELVSAFSQGDEEAVRLWNRFVHILACGLASVINLLDPEAIVVGGGIAQAGDLLFTPLNAALDCVEWRPVGEKVAIMQAQLDEWSGAYGAAFNVLKQGRR